MNSNPSAVDRESRCHAVPVKGSTSRLLTMVMGAWGASVIDGASGTARGLSVPNGRPPCAHSGRLGLAPESLEGKIILLALLCRTSLESGY